MKRICILLVLSMILTMTACGTAEETIPSTEPIETTAPTAPSEPAAELTIQNFEYAATTNLNDFWVSGTITSGADLDRLECVGTITSNALGISVSGESNEFYFPEGISTYELADLTDHFVSQFDELYELYTAMADVLGMDFSLTAKLTFTVYGTNGSSETLEMTVLITEGETAQGLVVKDLQTSTNGTLDQFQISGTIESDVPLVKLTGHGKASSNAFDIVVTDMSNPYYFEEGTTSVDMTAIRDYLVEQIGTICGLFGVIDMDNHEVTVDYTWECTNEAGNTVEFEIHYIVTAE